jgi:hypothetical protein
MEIKTAWRIIFHLPVLLFLKVRLIWNFLSKFGDELISIINTALDSISLLPQLLIYYSHADTEKRCAGFHGLL